VKLCDRHFGVGSDGLLLVRPSEVADFRMVMYNPDGSEAEMCGNGIRCFAKYLYDLGAVGDRLSVETGDGIKHLEVEVEGGVARRVLVNMGVPTFDPLRIPIAVEAPEVVDLPRRYADQELQLTAVGMGNPHAVHFGTADARAFPLERIGPLVEHDPLFPRRVNFEVARAVSPERIEVRVWERGAGITLACGTGACAAFAAARRKGLVGGRAILALPGGELEMRVGPDGEILMAGPAEAVFWGETSDD
jgi:diaminopimelate epimerase